MTVEGQNEEIVFVPEGQAQEIKKLDDIKAELEEINQNTADTKRWFLRGVLQGAGAIVGSILMFIFIGWLLMILGYIPGLGDMAKTLGEYANHISR